MEEEEGADSELERRSKFLSNLIIQNQRKKANNHNNNQSESTQQQQQQQQQQQGLKVRVRVRACDMALPLQNKAFHCARHLLDSMPPNKPDTKRLALSLKKEFDSAYGPAWHCIVGTSFGSYVTHSLGGFLYFSIDKLYVLLFKTAVEPVGH